MGDSEPKFRSQGLFEVETDLFHSRQEFARGRTILRWVGLMYSADFFIFPYFRHSMSVWIAFALFYAAFLVLYFVVVELRGRRQQIAFALFFLLGFLYYPFNRHAAGAFVYPFAIMAFFVRRLRTLFLVLTVQMVGIVLETWYFDLSMEKAESVLFFSVVIGLCNFAYSQQARANFLLEQANAEIEYLSQEAERERIARDLHDLLGHTLTVITVKLDLARRLLSRDSAQALHEIIESEQTARKALADVREAVVGYRAEGLTAEIARARRTLLSADVQLTTSIAPVALSPVQVNVLCLALREAVTNIVRHAHASACHMELSEVDAQIYLTVGDNGNGGTLREGNGLLGMRERLHAVSGTVKLSSSTKDGTRLVLALPICLDARLRPQSMREVESV
ncbi:sensor histidine kinase [Granulicella arctica]|uniref:Two-component system sensor histidine kinase DesK n=1 Tax=Granulicella arctica TaxID=940613 RepID=A0A7Y9THT5_9BACT|nr:sensor histidine kinase [Granulicella arctica]NYF80230.1 two-component system sensor histidine kinase DesK [Granulicella arctica]